MNSTFPIVKFFTVYCSTGCSCCSNENHYRGPFKTKEEAEKRIEKYRELVILASQYSKRGSYTISERTGELLPDGRVITSDRVYGSFLEDNPNVTAGDELEICEHD